MDFVRLARAKQETGISENKLREWARAGDIGLYSLDSESGGDRMSFVSLSEIDAAIRLKAKRASGNLRVVKKAA